jgi:phytoene dehydrogenase-like protein
MTYAVRQKERGMAETYDIVVAGAGHNSLICAAYLAKAGLRVLVLEARPVVGGDTVTEELTLPGFRHDSCSSAHVLFQSSPILRENELELDRYGLQYLYPDPVVTMPFEDGSSLTMWRDLERTAAEFARFSPKDAQAYRRLIAEYDAVKKVFGRNRYTPVGYGPSLDEALLALPDGPLWLRRYRQSALEIVNEYFEDEHSRAFMLWMSFMTLQPVDRPQSGRNAYAVANGRQYSSWTTPLGGSGALAQALARLIEEHGGALQTGKRVAELLLEGGRCRGVVTADGETYRAEKAVVSTIHIKHLVEMAPRDAWGELFVRGVEQWQPGFTMVVAHYALSEAPLYPIAGERRPAVAAGTAGSPDNLLRLMSDFRRGRIHQDDPVLLVICSSAVDQTRTPPGKHTLKVISFFPYELAEGGPARWDAIKEEVAGHNFAYLRRFAPNLTPETVLARRIESPLDLERFNAHNWRGSCHGGELSPAQSGALRPVPGWASHRMPIAGLYQTGATTHPGGSVTGAPGRNTAWVLLEDLGLSLQQVVAGKGEKAHA